MGYYSNFEGTVWRIDKAPFTNEEVKELIDTLQKKINDTTFEIETSTGQIDFFIQEAKWYSRRSDLEELSLLFPKYIFTVIQCGEDGQYWKMMACQGRYDCCAGEIIFPKLKVNYVIGE